MMLDALIAQLDGVRARSTGKWSARCPAHQDRSPSLSITEGDRGILIHCWAGCTIEEITAAMGRKPSDLFYDAGLPRHQRPIPTRPHRIDRVALAFRFELGALDRRLRAERIFEAATEMDLSVLTDAELDQALAHVAHGHADVERAALLEHLADALRERDFAERKSRARQTQAA